MLMPLLFPPAISTIPLFRSVAVAAIRGVTKLPVGTNPGITVIVALGLLVTPSAEAVICVAPSVRPFAIPVFASIVATPVALLVHVNVIPFMIFPWLSLAVAINCCVWVSTTDGPAGVTVMVARVGAGGAEVPHPEGRKEKRKKQKSAAIRRRAREESPQPMSRPHDLVTLPSSRQ